MEFSIELVVAVMIALVIIFKLLNSNNPVDETHGSEPRKIPI